jgi:tetratricopeptide (TPR) repeat protein
MSESSSPAWYLAQSGQGEQLLESGNAGAAAVVFQEILDKLGDSPSYERCQTLRGLGRCFQAMERLDRAEEIYRHALTLVDKLEESEDLKRQRAVLQSDLGNVFVLMGRYEEARTVIQSSLIVKQEIGDLRGEGIAAGQLGAVALGKGDLREAARRYREAVQLFQRLNEPSVEAGYWHQLGRVSQEARQWEEAERCYRESARIAESHGDLGLAARNWSQLAQLNEFSGKVQAAEAWYRKTLQARRQAGDSVGLARTVSNLSLLLLRHQPERLAEARQLAEESLAIEQTLDPGAGGIWRTYSILADIAGKQNDPSQAREYRCRARQAYRNFAGSRRELLPYAQFIGIVVATATQLQFRSVSPFMLMAMEQKGWTDLVPVIRRIMDGERDVEALCEPLNFRDSMIVEAILEGIKGPSSL